MSDRGDVSDPSLPIRTGLCTCQESREKELCKVEMSYKALINPHANVMRFSRPTEGISTEQVSLVEWECSYEVLFLDGFCFLKSQLGALDSFLTPFSSF